jgi:hypothetical protein
MNTSTAQQEASLVLVCSVTTQLHNKQRLLLKLVYEQRLKHLMYRLTHREKGVIPLPDFFRQMQTFVNVP